MSFEIAELPTATARASLLMMKPAPHNLEALQILGIVGGVLSVGLLPR
jgi:hypothetical protein